jgi:Transposase C of IS166 homeodomain
VQIDLDSLPNDPAVLQRMLREIVPELKAENEKLLLLIDALLRHRYGPRSEKLSLDQLRLALEDQEQADAERDAAKDAKDAAEPAEKRRRPPANRNRGVLPLAATHFGVGLPVSTVYPRRRLLLMASLSASTTSFAVSVPELST